MFHLLSDGKTVKMPSPKPSYVIPFLKIKQSSLFRIKSMGKLRLFLPSAASAAFLQLPDLHRKVMSNKKKRNRIAALGMESELPSISADQPKIISQAENKSLNGEPE